MELTEIIHWHVSIKTALNGNTCFWLAALLGALPGALGGSRLTLIWNSALPDVPREIPPPGHWLEVGTRVINLRDVLFLADFTLLHPLGCQTGFA